MLGSMQIVVLCVNRRGKTPLIAIMFRLERALLANADIIGLLRAQFGQFRTQLAKVQTGNFFVQMLWQHIDLAFVIIAVCHNSICAST